MREKIITAAAERFARYGFYKTTIEDIASDLNKVKSAVYYYFDTKEDIFKAVIEHELENLSKAIRAQIRAEMSPGEKLKIFLIARLMAFKKITKGYSTLKEIYFSKYDFVWDFRKQYDDRERIYIENIIKEGNKTGDFDVKDVRNTVFAVMAFVKGAEQEWVIKNEIGDIKNLSNIMSDIVVKAVSKEK